MLQAMPSNMVWEADEEAKKEIVDINIVINTIQKCTQIAGKNHQASPEHLCGSVTSNH